MEQRAAIPVGRPVANPTESYWQSPPSALARHGADKALPGTATVVIIGSGITGATVALELLSKDPNLSIVLLEARTAASGASGRNGGHTKTASYRSFLKRKDLLGLEEAIKIAKLEYDCMRAAHDLAREHQIPCDSWRGDTVDVIHDEVQMKQARESIAALQEALGKDHPAAKYGIWTSEETERLFHAPGARGAVSYDAGSLSAYKLVIGMLELAIKKGLHLYTETPVTELRRDEAGWEVATSRGAIRADKVVLATNGYTAHLYPKLQGIIVPLRGQVTAQRRGTKLPEPVPPTSYSWIYAEGYEYMIQRPPHSEGAGDIVIGGGYTKGSQGGLEEWGTTDDSQLDRDIQDYLESSTAQYFGRNWGDDDPQGRIKMRWSGIMGYSADALPLVGEMPLEKNLFISASFQGLGMVLAMFCGRALASMILGNEDKDRIRDWFPSSFQIAEARMKLKFKGRG